MNSRRVCILLLFDEILCIYLLSPSDIMCPLSLIFFIAFFVWMIYSLCKVVIKVPYYYFIVVSFFLEVSLGLLIFALYI